MKFPVDPSAMLISLTLSVGMLSFSTIATTPVLSLIVALVGLARITLKFSFHSYTRSSSVVSVIVCPDVPGVNVTVHVIFV